MTCDASFRTASNVTDRHLPMDSRLLQLTTIVAALYVLNVSA